MEGSFIRNMQPLIAPVYKAGLVLLRKNESGEIEVCLTQVKAKKGHEQDKVDFGLPKGTRMYYDKADHGLKDVRDSLTAEQYKATLEPLKETLAREAEEEIGLPAEHFFTIAGTVKELGVRV